VRTPLFGFFFSILFCALSLIAAELFSMLLVKYQFIEAKNKDIAHTLIMTSALIAYFYITLSDSDDIDDE
jgi:hypothetical protein